jgi:hypothetical protein
MIITRTCDFCGWNNDNNNGPCRKCGGQAEERLVKGKYRTVIIQEPTIPMQGYYNPDLRKVKSKP